MSAESATWPARGGEMGQRMRAHDWPTSVLGPVEGWSPALRGMTDIMLANGFPMLLWWGADSICLYNDPYIPLLGVKHPAALGRPVREVWAEINDVLEPLIAGPLGGGPPTQSENLELEVLRFGFREETHWAVAYSPVPDPSAPNGIGGVLAIVHEVTPLVVAQRRITLLRDLGATSEATSVEQVCRTAVEVCARDSRDILFARMYLVNATTHLIAQAGADDGRTWPTDEVARTGVAQFIDGADGRVAVMPVLSDITQKPAGVLVVGLTPRISLDVAHREFVELVAARIGSTLSAARAHAALFASESRFRALATATSDVVYRMSPDWSEMRQLVGRDFLEDTVEPILNWIANYVPYDEQPRVNTVIREAVRNRDVYELEHRVYQADGAIGWTFSRAIPILDDRGEIVEWFGTASDISERKRVEEQLRASEERYRTLFDSIDEGFCIFDMLYDENGAPNDYRFVEVNPAFEKHTGLQGARGRRIREMVPDQDQHWFDTYGKVAATGEPTRVQDRGNALGRWFDIYAFRLGGPGTVRVAAVFADISERKRAEHALIEADRRKDEFLAVLSHELRNPLAPISNSLHVLDSVPPDSEKAIRAREIIGRQVTHLASLVNDLLDTTRIVSGKVQLQKERMDVNDVVRRAVDDNRSLFDSAKVSLVFEPALRPVWVHADRTRIAQIVGNLLHNAAKFTPEGGHARAVVTTDGQQATVRVIDDGVGIEPDVIGRLFKPFAQAQQSLARSKGGLGLGLALVRSLVELHGGSVTAHSDGAGKGTELVLLLPIDINSTGDTPQSLPAITAPRRRVLIIEDNVDAADTLGEILEIKDNDVAVAYDGPTGLQKARELRPDVVLCDIGLPDMDGYEVARTFRAENELAKTFMIALSGYARPEDIARATEAGFNRHLAKPVNFDKLMSILNEVTLATPVNR